MSPTLEDLRDHVAELEAMDRRLQACLADVRVAHERAVTELTQAARADIDLRPIGAIEGAPQGFIKRPLALEQVRDAVVTLKHFTIGELAAELGCSHARARRELDRVMHLVKPDGRLGQRQLWAYVPPAGPGKAFEAQQRLRVADEPPPVAGQDIKQSILSMVSDKEIKKVVREALADGWELVRVGGKHPLALVKPGHKQVGISSSPTNSDHAARAIRRQLRAA